MNLLARYSPTPIPLVERALELAGVGPGDVLLDLGSGDGRVLRAAEARGARASGIEIDPARAAEPRDFTLADLSPATVVFAYLPATALARVRWDTLLEGARVVTVGWIGRDDGVLPAPWEPVAVEQVSDRVLRRYVVT